MSKKVEETIKEKVLEKVEEAKETVESTKEKPPQEEGSFKIKKVTKPKQLGDEKLVTQIGNTITFLTRSQVRGAEAAVDEVKTSKYTSLAEKVIARIKESRK